MRPVKEQRYDRQLRLWGDHGQFSIEQAKVCLIRASAVGSEILKNLVLPGLGSFTIVDDACVCEEDLGSNFFLPESSLNKYRAEVVTEYLCELNESVVGNYVVEDFKDLLENDPQFFLGFSIIIVTDARESLLIRMSRLLQGYAIPVIVCISVGVIGYLRVCTQEHVIIESHPDSTKPDVRLDCPPAGLIELANEVPLEEMNSEQLCHLPWLIILHLFVQQFIKQYGHFPQNHKEKATLRTMLLKAQTEFTARLREREPNLEASYNLESFQEAIRAVNTAVCPTEVPAEVRELLEDEQCFSTTMLSSDLDGVTSVLSRPQAKTACAPGPVPSSPISSKNFWRMVCALRDFVQNEGGGQLPVRGSLPDMTSDSRRYLKLLSVYRERFEWAVERLASRLKQFPDITLDDIRLFVRNAAFLRVIRCRSLEEEMKLSPARSDDLTLIPTHEENNAMLWYIVLRGAASFLQETGRWPGSTVPYIVRSRRSVAKGGDHETTTTTTTTTTTQYTTNSETNVAIESTSPSPPQPVIESDLHAFRTHLNRILRSFGIAPNRVSWDYVNEMCRFGGGELHSVAAFMGGIVAQEAIKLLTHQFVPVSKPLVYNAITQRVELLDF